MGDFLKSSRRGTAFLELHQGGLSFFSFPLSELNFNHLLSNRNVEHSKYLLQLQASTENGSTPLFFFKQ